MRSTVALTAAMVMAGSAIGTAVPATAQPMMHAIKYVVTADAPFYADIYYREVDPPTFSDYSHNPYVFSPKAEANVGPDQPWVFETRLADPGRWAMVVVTSGESPELQAPKLKCELSVDGVVVKTAEGTRGALCSLRDW
ncbi:hypothetical protein A5757_02725 [Mycobacterium sp. 852013-51886_SCH5428379]|uniref:hypothetical protein n=1 Tax=Mycobacterium sp. 852013-51886_SCH5428379 TaxID=1834111 RepID=UPI000801532F|nr:hypothetical protein [Mycobacterium sp. 852013-51886_SCH5428379]OBB55973.1 hypothetical protein A5757_02725 [Mycobacterium sp. 852013-51886_SCH5428379]